MKQEAGVWGKILLKITSQERMEKCEDQPWIDYFKTVAQLEKLEAPAMFQSKDLSYEDVIINIGQHLGMLKKKAALAQNAANRASARKQQKETREAKKAEKMKVKADTLLQNPEKVVEQTNKQK